MLGAACVVALSQFLSDPQEVERAQLARPASPSAAPAALTSFAEQAAAIALPAEQPSVQGLILRGVFMGGPKGGAAILGFPDRPDRLVAAGEEFLPGLRLKEIGPAHVIIGGGDRSTRLELGRATSSLSPTAAIGSAASTANRAAPQAISDEAQPYQAGLEPVKTEGRISGFAVRAGADMPHLARAGLMPGDILVAVNGQAFESEEKLLELPSEIAGSFTAEFEFIRAGKKMKRSLEINNRS